MEHELGVEVLVVEQTTSNVEERTININTKI